MGFYDNDEVEIYGRNPCRELPLPPDRMESQDHFKRQADNMERTFI